MKHSGIVTTRYLFLKILKIITIKVICCIVILFQCFTSVAQIGNSDADKIIPANPEASSMARYIDFPVGYNTGVPDISIPLYSVKSEGLTIPIELRYHAGGLKIGQMPTKVGLGWSLSPNLEITRSINGGDDLDPNNGYYYRNEIGPYIENCSTCFPGSTALQLLNLSNNDLDGQADRFQYNLLGKSGIFYFQKYAGGVAKAITVPLTGIKIELVGTNAFKITDTDGTVYWFGSKDAPSTNAFTVRMQNHSTYQSPVVSWKCSEITNPSKTGTIYFSYAYKYEQYSNYHEKIQVFENTNPCQGLGGGTIDAEIVYPGSLQVIENPDGVPNSFNFYQLSCPKYYNNSMGYYDRGFHMVWQSQDEYGNIGTEDTNFPHDFLTPPQVITTEVGLSLNSITFNGGSVVFDESNQLNTIKIFDDNGKEIRTFNFIQSYANSCGDTYDGDTRTDRGSRYLDNVEVKKGDVVLEKYSFEYNGKICLKGLKGADAWGGINGSQGPINGPSRVPSQQISSDFIADNNCNFMGPIDYSIGFGNLTPNESYMKSGILTKIIYPTGGNTTFNFAANKYRDSHGTIKTGGGLRIESIKYFDGNSTESSFEKIYKYGKDEDGSGILKLIPDKNSPEGGYKYQQKMKYVNPEGWDVVSHHWNFITFFATEDMTTYESNSVRDLSFSSGAPIYYTEVAEYQKDLGQSTGKTIYKYNEDAYNGYNPSYIVPYTNLTIESGDWHMGKLESVTQYKYEDDSYDWVHEKDYEYLKHEKHEQVLNQQVFALNVYDLSGEMLYDAIYTSDFQEMFSGIKVGRMLVSKETEKWMGGGQLLEKATNYYYDKLSIYNDPLEILQPTRISTTIGNGKTETRYIYYPGSFASGTVSYVDDLKINNMIDFPVEQVKTVNDAAGEKVIDGQIISYNANGLPDQTYATELTSPKPIAQFNFFKNGQKDIAYKVKTSFTYDDKGNPKVITPKNDLSVAYLWDYQRIYPIAEVKNAVITDIAYTSFEADGSGNWTFDGTPDNASGSTTGNMAYLLSNGTISNSQLSNTKTYIISYWQKGGSVSIAGGTQTNGLTGASINGWVYHEVTITGTTDVSINGSGYIDELRLYPSNAQMTTFTYEPMIGKTSQCDPSNRITYYGYDLLGRLNLVRDQNKNILKRICYSYQGQPGECQANTNPLWEPTGNYRCVVDANDENTGYQENEEKDVNPGSMTYSQFRWLVSYNSIGCPLPPICDYSSCGFQGESYGCIDGQCEDGYRVNTDSYYDNYRGWWWCIYHYEYSDGSWSPDFSESNDSPCDY